ncbi:PAAR domain-containing protein [Burkholderia sp. JKS000303]|uniref:PAAR domain-containing protein n=1 Tax=Burkholderia sp. JKS000303 TaxID=1938747 RepID=UPI000BF40544|nr:PAAR domain-containing protein [Burkholderia sp. JKS000303]PFH29284.1 PAAR motif-containing protein [Burkholderia sp. JKS000303]
MRTQPPRKSSKGGYMRGIIRVGDTCSCLVHGKCTIVEGDPNFNVEGRAAAFDGHKTSCGAALISLLADSGRI